MFEYSICAAAVVGGGFQQYKSAASVFGIARVSTTASQVSSPVRSNRIYPLAPCCLFHSLIVLFFSLERRRGFRISSGANSSSLNLSLPLKLSIPYVYNRFHFSFFSNKNATSVFGDQSLLIDFLLRVDRLCFLYSVGYARGCVNDTFNNP